MASVAELRPSPTAQADPSSIDLQRRLISTWKKEISSLGYHTRIRWLTSAEGLIAFGSEQAHKMAKRLRKERRRLSLIVCSRSWLDATDAGEKLPSGLVLSRNEIRIGLDGPTHRRMTPSIAVEMEDELDDLSAFEAEIYDYPRSPSAAAIEQIGWRKARPAGGRW